MQLISMKLGENKRHMIMLFNIKVIYTFNHNNLLITSLKVFDFLYHLSLKSCLMLPDHLLLVSVDTMTLHQQTRLSKLSEQNLLGVINNIADFLIMLHFTINMVNIKEKICFHHFSQNTFFQRKILCSVLAIL